MRNTIICAIMLIGVVALSSCRKSEVQNFSGMALGTYYSITYVGAEDSCLHRQVDSVFHAVNAEFSIFDSTSRVSLINRNLSPTLSPDMAYLIRLSERISRETAGAFDITVGPLVNALGFGADSASSADMDAIREYVGYRKISITDGELEKQDPRIQLNFNAIAKGFAIDKIAELLAGKGYSDFVVDVGGEVLVRGEKSAGQPWNVGVQIPTETKDGLIEADYVFALKNRSVATSGNYRNYKESDGKRYSHIINPVSGQPEQSELLSVTVIASDCATADAYATAFMVLGIEESMTILLDHKELAAHFVYFENGQYQYRQTENFPPAIQ